MRRSALSVSVSTCEPWTEERIYSRNKPHASHGHWRMRDRHKRMYTGDNQHCLKKSTAQSHRFGCSNKSFLGLVTMFMRHKVHPATQTASGGSPSLACLVPQPPRTASCSFDKWVRWENGMFRFRSTLDMYNPFRHQSITEHRKAIKNSSNRYAL